jgi:hypothetical protein
MVQMMTLPSAVEVRLSGNLFTRCEKLARISSDD